MRVMMTLALAAALAAPPSALAQPAASIAVSCGAAAATAGGEAHNLHGNWDLVFDAGGTPNFGLLSIGRIDAGYGGSLALWSTAPVVLRSVALTGNSIRMAVATSGGDVMFDGRLSASGDRMCGTVTYHDGRTFPMVAQRRPSTYPSRPQPERAR